MILYFSGSGNSRYAAKIIAETMGDELISMNDRIKAGNKGNLKSEKPLVFVSPIYCGRIPRVFEEHIQETRFEGNKKTYFVTTCYQSPHNAEQYLEKFCKEKGFDLAGFDAVTMPQCYIIMYQPPNKAEAEKIIKSATPKFIKIANTIKKEQPLHNETHGGSKMMSGIINPMVFYPFLVTAKGFYTTDACIGCGKCVERCTLNNITIVDGKPNWGNNCTHCTACIGGCPKEAIEFKNKTQGKPRYYLTDETQR